MELQKVMDNMLSSSRLYRSGVWCIRLTVVAILSTLLLLAADRHTSTRGEVSAAAVVLWHAVDQPVGDGSYSYLRQIPAYQMKNNIPFSFFATKSIWIFGTGDAMLVEWVETPAIDEFQIKFGYLDEKDVNAIAAAPDKAARDQRIANLTAGGLTQTTSAVFNGQSGVYLADGDEIFTNSTGASTPPNAVWLPEILFDPALTPEIEFLLARKYKTSKAKRDVALLGGGRLAVDAQIYPAAGQQQFLDDTKLALYLPGYAPGIPTRNENSNRAGWNNTISMNKDPELWMNGQGLSYNDLAAGNRRWGVIFAWNSHLDYDGRETPSKDVEPNSPLHSLFHGLLTPVWETEPGLLNRSMILLNTTWAGVPLTGERNVVSHSTGYYLAMDLLHHMETIWPKTPKTRYFAMSPNIRGSTMIGSSIGSQAFDSQDDMYRDNWHWDSGYRKNQNTQDLLQYRVLNDVESHIMLAYGDTTTGGVGGTFLGVVGDNGVVDYTNYQPHFTSGGPENLDDKEYGRRKRFSTYESLFNMENDGGQLNKAVTLAEWENGGDRYLLNFRKDTVLSVFGKHINFDNQLADDEEDYRGDHSALGQRMMIMKMAINGQNVPYVPKPGKPVMAESSDTKPGVVKFSWTMSPDQSAVDTDGHIGGQKYEVVRRIKGTDKALNGWEDKWWQRVAVKHADGNSLFDAEYRSYETIIDTVGGTGRNHGLWSFKPTSDDEIAFSPTWLDRSFNGKDLWVRVLNGPLEGGFFKVEEVQDYVGLGYTDAGALGSPVTFPNKMDITLGVANNPVFGNLTPDDDDYLTLGGISYQYNATYFGPVDEVRSKVDVTFYSDPDERANQGTGHFMSVKLGDDAAEIATDTISPTISFGMAP